ncbi:MAG: hypothetical protein KGL35_23375, partial [Bradyrhizobium sp.]|nr:hypothetical protein [Bradyrhizobium sp.]
PMLGMTPDQYIQQYQSAASNPQQYGSHVQANSQDWQNAVNAWNTGGAVAPQYYGALQQINQYYKQGQAAPGSMNPILGSQYLYQKGKDAAAPSNFFSNIASNPWPTLVGAGAAALTGGSSLVADMSTAAAGATTGAAGAAAGTLTGDIQTGNYNLKNLATNTALGAAGGATLNTLANSGTTTPQGTVNGTLNIDPNTGVPIDPNTGQPLTTSPTGGNPPGGTLTPGTPVGTSPVTTGGNDPLNTPGSPELNLANNPNLTNAGGDTTTTPTTPTDTGTPTTPTDTGTPPSSNTSSLSGLASIPGYASLAAAMLALTKGMSSINSAISASDPFASSRSTYAGMLNNLMKNPSSIVSTPGYQGGLQGVEASMASQGYLGSGNMMSALQNYSGNIYNQQVQTLGQLAGANINPNANAYLGGAESNLQTMLQSIGLLSQGFNSLTAATTNTTNPSGS